MIDADQAHVLLDAAAEMRDLIKAGDRSPWNDYDGDTNDPKTSASGYAAVLNAAIDNLNQIVSTA